MSLMGYDPLAYFTGRAPLEAAAQGITLGPDDWAVRCNLVTIRDQGDDEIMEDFTAGHVTTAEATELLAAAQRGLAADFPDLVGWEFQAGRELSQPAAPSRPGRPDWRTWPPICGHAAARPHGSCGGRCLPRGTGSRLLTDIMAQVRNMAGWPSRERGPHRGRQAAGDERLAVGRGPGARGWSPSHGNMA